MANEFSKKNQETLDEAIKLITDLRVKISSASVPPQPGSDLANDELATIQPVHPAQMAGAMLANAWSCLDCAREIYQPGSNYRVTAVESLLRTALIASSRAAYMLIPDDPMERQDNATRIAHASFSSGLRAWNVLGDFKHLIDNASGGRDVFTELYAHFDRKQYRGGEEQLIKDMIKSIVPRLQDHGDEEYLFEYLLLMWHGYSGVAHANLWQQSLSQFLMEGEGSVAVGDLTSNLLTVAQVAEFSAGLYHWRSFAHAPANQAGTAGHPR